MKKKLFAVFEEPIRSEIFGIARIEAHAESLAREHIASKEFKSGEPIAPRIADNQRILDLAYSQVIKAIRNHQAITPASELLVDNNHVVRALLKEIQDYLPPQFYHQLPKLTEGHLQGYPRIYGIAWAFVAHTDSRFDPEILKCFLRAYQRIQPLTIGELWAVSITIRSVLIENLRRLSVRIVGAQIARQRANQFANEILGLSETGPRFFSKIMADLEKELFSQPFAVQLLQRLRFQEAAADPILEWIDRHLRENNLVADSIVSNEHSSQTAANATMRNIIASSRLISVFDWQTFFEEVSIVNEILSEHPGYQKMDFTSRDRYRHGLEELARYAQLTEIDVARQAIQLARQAELKKDSTSSFDPVAYARLCDPGYYLISSGRRNFEEQINYRPPLRGRMTRFLIEHNTIIYISSILCLAILILAVPIFFTFCNSMMTNSFVPFLIIALVGLFPATEISVNVINRFFIKLIGPKYLPRLNLTAGLHEEIKTFVVVPSMLISTSGIDQQIEQLEAHYLSNPIAHVYFALLTDWCDSDFEINPQDRILLDYARERMFNLNKKYQENHFFLLHRRRVYYKQDDKWMGWERKRGKLHEFNLLLLGNKETTYLQDDLSLVKIPEDIRYVITLDSDTKLPMGSVAQLVGTIAHPLNRAGFDQAKQRVTQGYGILQPRVTAALPSREDFTLFQRLSTERSGLDPYTFAVSDIYQDLFEEGTFTGKGIYDVLAFEASLKNRVPENSLLSHDLFEGNFARCGFLSDCEFFEDFPSHTGVASLRTHRWIRGDWQLLTWIFGSRGSSIPMIGRWKMLDNLRRSLTAIMTLLVLILPLVFLDTNWGVWLALAFVSMGISESLTFAFEIFPKPAAISWAQHLLFTGQDFILSSGRSLFYLALMPHQAWVNGDAVVRALYRMFISHHHLLEWTTAAQSIAAANLNRKNFWISMSGGLFLVVLTILAIATTNPIRLVYSIPILMVWIFSPFLAHYFSSPPSRGPILPVRPENIKLLLLAARRTWRFFDTFVTANDHFLPPDNFQEDPFPVLAHRSSPTNFGLYLLSTFAAHDFGWIGLLELSDRLDSTLNSLEKLPKHEGHFFNWYETTDARPLEPKYISSVDNGNLAGHLLTVAQGCLEKRQENIILSLYKRGHQQAISLLEINLEKIATTNQTLNFEAETVRECCSKLIFLITRRSSFIVLKEQSQSLLHAAQQLALDHRNDLNCTEVLYWSVAIHKEIESLAQDFFSLISWTDFAESALPDTFSKEQQEVWSTIKISLVQPIVLSNLPHHCDKLILTVSDFALLMHTPESQAFTQSLLYALEVSKQATQSLSQKFLAHHNLCLRLFHQMNFGRLYDPLRRLFSIGLRVSDNKLDDSYYDLLASEARLTSFIAIAKGDVPVAHWFALGRTLTPVESGSALVSWSGSMFEYLMPCLVMHTPQGSLLEQTCRLIIRRQISYAKSKSVVWGISESAYNKRDLHFTYQYSNFGVPDLGLKHGLGADLVIAPYASFLAAMFGAREAAENLLLLEEDGACGRYGFYEAIDYTESRLPEGATFAVVKAYMAHHQGMILVALANIFKGGIMRKRFHSEALVSAAELLLQERVPRHVRTIKPNIESEPISVVRETTDNVSRRYHQIDRPTPTTGLISNGNYTVMITSAGSGYSRFKNIALTRWREDTTRDHWGSYFFLKDLASHKVWSATYQPTLVKADEYDVDFAEDRANFSRIDDNLVCKLEIIVSPEDHAETRRISLTNQGEFPRQIEITSYSEIVINNQAADIAHPAFSNLFIQTEYLQEFNALFAKRRPRSSNEKTIWMGQILLTSEQCFGATEFETDRSEFIGRCHSIHKPQALEYNSSHRKLSHTVGSILDPIFSLRTKVWLDPGVSTELYFCTFVAESREDLLKLTEKFHMRSTYDRVGNTAWTQSQVKLNHLNIEPIEAHQFQRLATRLLYSDSSLRPSGEILKRNKQNVSGLWAYGISGDYPIVLLRIDDIEDRSIVQQLLKFQEYLATKYFIVDLVIINEKAVSYVQELQASLEAMVHSSTVAMQSILSQSRGKVFVLRVDLLPGSILDLLYAETRVTLSSRLGSLAEQILRQRPIVLKPQLITKIVNAPNINPPHYNISLATPTLNFFNGLGGFAKEGREYVVILTNNEQTPAPWINIIAHEHFGFQVSESGSGYTWALNSRENQLTPWSNDPVCDPSGEAFYILDRETGDLWSPTALPIRVRDSKYITSHGQGYSRFEHAYHGIRSELVQFIVPNESVKISSWTLHNGSLRNRKLSLTGYVEWVLGFSRSGMAPTTITELDKETELIFATNAHNIEFGERIAFSGFIIDRGSISRKNRSFTGDRSEFLGRNCSLLAPTGVLQLGGLSGRVGASLDPCAAQQLNIELKAGEKIELTFVLGQADDRQQIRKLIQKIQDDTPKKILAQVIDEWDHILGQVQVETPDPAFNIMLNRWLLYQTLVCRIWSRSAFYQAGGAFGFRDQLQDIMALLLSKPTLARHLILRAASHQFIEGDVQHWWHPPSGRGVRTHFSDDLLWIPYVVVQYLKVTDDQSILNEDVAYIEGPPLPSDKEDSYFTPTSSHHGASIYEHCALAIDCSLKIGVHNLPLIGGGDWNDGMNRIGKDGKGESVWLAWFLFVNLNQFIPLAEQRGQTERVKKWRDHSNQLLSNIEQEAWDGEWYRRAFFDDGTPLGSASNDECRIDSLAQTWAVISGAASPQRQHQAMASLEKHLVQAQDRLLLLFTPPFDKTHSDPGYIKGYLPGVRENGGQYTHAAAWVVIATALMGNGKRATELFSMLNPINHGLTRKGVECYKLEPYVMAGDIYAVPPHTGRGGWSWYTGSAAWMYRAGLEFILGFSVEGDHLTLNPKISTDWPYFKIQYRHGNSHYAIEVKNIINTPTSKMLITLDNKVLESAIRIPLIDDGKQHQIILFCF